MNDPLAKLFGRPDEIAKFFAKGEKTESLKKFVSPDDAAEKLFWFDEHFQPTLICENPRQARLLEDCVEACLQGVVIANKLLRIADGPNRQEAQKAWRELRHVMTDLEPYWGIFEAWLKFQAEGVRFRSELRGVGDAVEDANFAADLELTAQAVEQGH